MKAKNLTDYSGELDFNLQVVSSELDTSAKRLKYFSNEDATDATTITAFTNAWKEIKENGNLIVNINDNTELYEYGDDSTIVVLYQDLSLQMIIVDKQDIRTIQSLIKYQ